MPEDMDGCNCATVPRLRVLTKIKPRLGSNEAPDQLPPPSELGKTRLGTIRYGVFGPIFTAVSYCSLQLFSVAGEILLTSSRVMAIREIGPGFNGNGWVGEALSPGAS